MEANLVSSNQHEFNGTNDMKAVFGNADDQKKTFEARFMYLNDFDEATVYED